MPHVRPVFRFGGGFLLGTTFWLPRETNMTLTFPVLQKSKAPWKSARLFVLNPIKCWIFPWRFVDVWSVKFLFGGWEVKNMKKTSWSCDFKCFRNLQTFRNRKCHFDKSNHSCRYSKYASPMDPMGKNTLNTQLLLSLANFLCNCNKQ